MSDGSPEQNAPDFARAAQGLAGQAHALLHPVLPDADDTAGLVAFVRRHYPLGDAGIYTTTLRIALHRLADRAEALQTAIETAAAISDYPDTAERIRALGAKR